MLYYIIQFLRIFFRSKSKTEEKISNKKEIINIDKYIQVPINISIDILFCVIAMKTKSNLEFTNLYSVEQLQLFCC